jgi:arginyl-tRNA synthetase
VHTLIVLEEAIELAKQNIEEKNPNLKQKEVVAKQVGVGVDFSLQYFVLQVRLLLRVLLQVK